MNTTQIVAMYAIVIMLILVAWALTGKLWQGIFLIFAMFVNIIIFTYLTFVIVSGDYKINSYVKHINEKFIYNLTIKQYD